MAEDDVLSSPLATLGRELGIESEADSAAIVTILLKHYQHRIKETKTRRLSALLEDEVSSPELVCHVALSTATDWVSTSPERADALLQYGTFMQQIEEWTSNYRGAGNGVLIPYVSGLQLLLRLCMNSLGAAEVRWPPAPGGVCLVAGFSHAML
jgi:hypothetical protein